MKVRRAQEYTRLGNCAKGEVYTDIELDTFLLYLMLQGQEMEVLRKRGHPPEGR